MNYFSMYFQYLGMKSLIKLATESIYSEQFDFEKVEATLISKSSKLKALIAIKYAVTANEPLSKVNILEALDETKLTKIDLEEGRAMEIFLTLLRDSTKLDWLKRTEYILNGKLANKKNKYSFEGSVYSLEKIKKGPATYEEKEKWRILCKEVIEAQENLKRIEQDLLEKMDEDDSNKKAQAVLDKIIVDMKERRKNMTDEEIKEEIVQSRLNINKSIESIKSIVNKNK